MLLCCLSVFFMSIISDSMKIVRRVMAIMSTMNDGEPGSRNGSAISVRISSVSARFRYAL